MKKHMEVFHKLLEQALACSYCLTLGLPHFESEGIDTYMGLFEHILVKGFARTGEKRTEDKA